MTVGELRARVRANRVQRRQRIFGQQNTQKPLQQLNTTIKQKLKQVLPKDKSFSRGLENLKPIEMKFSPRAIRNDEELSKQIKKTKRDISVM